MPVPLSCPFQAFFNDKYVQEHPEDLEKIEKLKDLIAWQVRQMLLVGFFFVFCISLIVSFIEHVTGQDKLPWPA